MTAAMVLFSCKEAPKERQTESENATTQAEQATFALYEDLEGNPIEIEDYKGKRVLLNYWATWCRPCIGEMPDLLELQAILADENYIFLLASDESVQKIKEFKNTRGYNFEFIKYNGTHAEQQIYALPVTLIFNEAGEQVLRFDGAMPWVSTEMIKKIKKLH